MGIGTQQWKLVIGLFVQYNGVSKDMTQSNISCKTKCGFIFQLSILIILSILARSCIEIYYKSSNYTNCKANQFNHFMRQTHGNIKAPSLRVIHWNKGCSNFFNKIDDIKTVIDKFWPHIFSLGEANYDIMDKMTIDGYYIETDRMNLGNKVARTIILIDKQLNYTKLD